MLNTDRLLLRRPTYSDADIIEQILSCPIQTRYLPNEKPYTPIQQQEYLENRIRHWDEHGFGTLTLCLNDGSQTKVGFVGTEFVTGTKYIDIRFAIAKEFEGLGYAIEAAEALTNWFFENTEHKILYGVAVAENLASKSVLHRLGMLPEPDVDLYQCEGLDTYILKSDFHKRLHQTI